MTDKPIMVGLGAHVGVDRETNITSGSNAGSKIMVFFFKYVVPSASAFPITYSKSNQGPEGRNKRTI